MECNLLLYGYQIIHLIMYFFKLGHKLETYYFQSNRIACNLDLLAIHKLNTTKKNNSKIHIERFSTFYTAITLTHMPIKIPSCTRNYH